MTGFVTSAQDDLAPAMARVGEIDRRACRERAERLFSVAAMARGYEEIFYRMLDNEGRLEPAGELLATASPPPPG